MDDIINYTMENPDNTNPNVLRSMLENYSGSSSSGYKVEEDIIHENENAVFANNNYDFTATNPFRMCYVSINGKVSSKIATLYTGDGPEPSAVLCGRYRVKLTLIDTENGIIRVTATPSGENIPSLSKAPVKLFNKSVEVSDDFVLAVKKATEIINGSE